MFLCMLKTHLSLWHHQDHWNAPDSKALSAFLQVAVRPNGDVTGSHVLQVYTKEILKIVLVTSIVILA